MKGKLKGKCINLFYRKLNADQCYSIHTILFLLFDCLIVVVQALKLSIRTM